MLNETKTVVVTGASQGIGAAVVKTFLERGYSVVANSRNKARVKQEVSARDDCPV